jgi:hypothetical protein
VAPKTLRKKPPARKRGKGRAPLVHDGRALYCTSRFEDEARAAGYEAVVGVDEVGRGALCGPVVAGAAILGEGFDTEGLDDSKRLTRAQRERLAERIRAHARAWALCFWHGLAAPHRYRAISSSASVTFPPYQIHDVRQAFSACTRTLPACSCTSTA